MFPDFICIGAQKAGTTWLYYALQPHPQVWFPPVKEFHYFDLPTPLPTAAVTAHRKRFRTQIRKMGRALRDGRHQDLVWLSRYLFLPRSDDWYASLFEPPAGCITGDVTPAYSRLDERRVARICGLAPHARIIFIMRDPVERIWSQARMDLGRRGKLEGMSDDALIRWLESPSPTLGTDYMRTLRIWQRHYPPEQLHVGFLDEISRDPASYLRTLQQFLGISTDHVPPGIDQAKNTSAPASIPPVIARYLAARYRPLCAALHERFGNEHTARWLARAEALLENDPATR